MRYLCIIPLLLLAGCQSPQERAEDMANYINANYGLVCEKLGYVSGSEKHRDCMVSMFNGDQIRHDPGWTGGWGGAWRRR